VKTHAAKDNLHERARRLVDAERVEGIDPDERRWLQSHLASCEDCARWAETTETTLRVIRSVSVALPPGLAASASRRVRARAESARQQRARYMGLAIGCALSWIAGVASAPLVWKACAWLGSTFGLPRIVWEVGFVCWWFVPAAAAGLVLMWVRARSEQEASSGCATEDLNNMPSRRW
jgi:hypothetical protein